MDAKTNLKSRLPSRHATEGPERAPHRAFYYAMGLTSEQIHQPFVGVATCWNEAAPCNIALMRQAQAVKQGVAAGGATPREFCTITVTDGIAMGHAGMKSSLPSREVIADSIELTMRGHCYDALIGVAGCDKSQPGMMMAMCRLNVPSIFIYGGSILPGTFKGRPVTIQDVYEAVGKHSIGEMSDADLHTLEQNACPSAGACGAQFTANTMATVSEAIGLALPYSAGAPAPYEIRDRFCMLAGEMIMDLIVKNIRPRDIVTRELPASLLLIGFARQIEGRAWPFVLAGLLGLVSVVGVATTASVVTVASAAVLGFACGAAFALALTLPPLLSTPSEVAGVSGAMFTISYASTVVVSVLSGLAWDFTGAARFAFLPIALSALPVALLALTIRFDRKPRVIIQGE